MQYYKQIDVTVADGKEAQVDIITSTDVEPAYLLAIQCEKLANLDLIVNIARERIVDIPSDARPLDTEWIPMEGPLTVGQSLSVGFRNSTGSPATKYIVLKYEIRKA